jgi:hypothetical protein
MDTVARLKDHIHPPGSAVFRQSVRFRAKNRENAKVILSPGDFKQTVDRVKSLIGC